MNEKAIGESILQTVRAFMAGRIILSAAELDLFTLLAQAPLSAQEAAAALGADTRALTILLDALSALDLLHKEEDRYLVPAPLIPVLSASGPDSILPMLLHQGTLWHNWSRLTDILTGSCTPGVEKDGALAPHNLRAFIGAMHVVASRTAPQVVAAVNPASARRLLDVGGGPGTYTEAFLAAAPQLKATLFDLAPVIEMARERLAVAGLEERVTFAAGDFNSDALPGGHDLALLSAIIHQNSPKQNLRLFQKVFQALEAGGRIVIRDYVMAPERTEPQDGALFAVNMLTATSGGNTYTFEEIKDGLTRAGFFRVRLLQLREMSSLVEGFKP